MWNKILLEVEDLKPFAKFAHLVSWSLTGYAMLLLFLQDIFLNFDLVTRVVFAIMISLILYFYAFLLVYGMLKIAGLTIPNKEHYKNVVFFISVVPLFTTLICILAYSLFILAHLIDLPVIRYADLLVFYSLVVIMVPPVLVGAQIRLWRNEFRFADEY